MTKEEQANQELIRIAELRIKEIKASRANVGRKGMLLNTASIACLVFFITQPITKEEYGLAINIILFSLQILFIYGFYSVIFKNIKAVDWIDVRTTGWEALLNEHANSSMSLIEIQKRVLADYEDMIQHTEKMHAKILDGFKDAVSHFIRWCFFAVVFIMLINFIQIIFF